MNPLASRRAGVLLHPTSLPGAAGNGTLGADARRFIDLLQAAGISVWQMLPLGPTHTDRSPYQCLSVHAGSTELIALEDVAASGWLDPGVAERASRTLALQQAQQTFQATADADQKADYEGFRTTQRDWLEDFALYSAIRQAEEHRPWFEWPDSRRDVQQARANADNWRDDIEQVCFEQYLFFTQWAALHDYARARGVLLFGDLPIYVAHDSADIWARPDLFTVDSDGQAETVAGVPPDYFSATGQRWGNPLYRWDRLAGEGYAWWVERFRTQLALFDLLRLDHFRGFEKFWSIPAAAETAVDGHWEEGPGGQLFDQLLATFGTLPLVAEDLGIITPEVDALRQAYGFPGMKILQFAFDGGTDNPYLPANHEANALVYTGTHDNDTTAGWYQALDATERARVDAATEDLHSPMPQALIDMALDSVATLAVVPMQDLLGLDSTARMNTPGTIEGNWSWRFAWSDIPTGFAEELRARIERADRLVAL